MTAALPIVASMAATLLASDERSLFHIPGAEEFRSQAIARTEREENWPFSVEEGYLACAFILGRPAVYFIERLAENGGDPRVLILSTNPFDLVFANLTGGGLLKPDKDVARLIRRVAPFEQAGARLCNQPQGAEIGFGEL